MANIVTSAVAAQTGVNPTMLDGMKNGGSLHVVKIDHKFTASATSGTVVELCSIPGAAIVMPALGAIYGNCTSGSTLTIGSATGAIPLSGKYALGGYATSGGTIRTSGAATVISATLGGTTVTSGGEFELYLPYVSLT